MWTRYPRTARIPSGSVIGPWPGTTVGALSAIIASHAATQLAIGPAHTIGVQPMRSRSPANNTPASGPCTPECPGRGPADKNPAAGEHPPATGHMQDGLRRRMGRAEIEQVPLPTAHLDR